MKKLLLAIFIIVPFLLVAQNIKKQKVKTSFLSYPKIDMTNIDVNSMKVDFCPGDMKFMSKSTKKTTNACKAKGASVKDAKAIEVFYYNFSVLAPVSYLRISNSGGEIKYIDKVSEGGKSSADFGKKMCYWAEPVLESAYKKGKAKFEATSNKENTKKDLKTAKELTNGALFFTYVPQEIHVHYVKSKDHNYTDLEKASEAAAEGYKGIKGKSQDKGAQSKLNEAIAIWEKAMTESTPDNKKSRINKKVTLHVAENLGSAYMYLMDFEKAKEVVSNALALEKNITNNGTVRRKALLANIKNYKKGYEMNKNTPVNMTTSKVSITTHPSSEIATFKEEYKKHGYAEAKEEMAAKKEEYNKAVESGEVNPYQRYVVAATTGKQLTLPDLASKLSKEPAGEKLNEFPDAITELTDLDILILRGNNLTTIPASISKLSKLKKLVLTNNKLTTLPGEIGALKNLKTLNLKGNNISPKEVSRIQSLLPGCKIKM